MVNETQEKRRIGINRWLILALIVVSVILTGLIAPIMPHIQLPAERISHSPLFTLPIIGEFYLTNTLVATLLADLVLIAIAFSVRRAARSDKPVFSGFASAVEAIIEALYNLTESTAGKWAVSILPYFATIVLLVLVANWMELIPGVDTIGFLEHSEHGYNVREVIPGVVTIVKDASEHGEGNFVLVPFMRAAATDLNFTLALALISVVMTQVIGVRALGPRYFGIHRYLCRSLGDGSRVCQNPLIHLPVVRKYFCWSGSLICSRFIATCYPVGSDYFGIILWFDPSFGVRHVDYDVYDHGCPISPR
jgi:F-type H+-transporting ATPase subunit a